MSTLIRSYRHTPADKLHRAAQEAREGLHSTRTPHAFVGGRWGAVEVLLANQVALIFRDDEAGDLCEWHTIEILDAAEVTQAVALARWWQRVKDGPRWPIMRPSQLFSKKGENGG